MRIFQWRNMHKAVGLIIPADKIRAETRSEFLIIHHWLLYLIGLPIHDTFYFLLKVYLNVIVLTLFRRENASFRLFLVPSQTTLVSWHQEETLSVCTEYGEWNGGRGSAGWYLETYCTTWNTAVIFTPYSKTTCSCRI